MFARASAAPPPRRHIANYPFERDKLYLDEDGVQRAELSDLYTDILAEDLVRDLEKIETNPEQAFARGSTSIV